MTKQVTHPRAQLIIYNVRSVLNVGALFRTADAVGVGKIWLTGYTPGPDTHADKIDKTALGATKTVQWGRVRHIGSLLRMLRAEGVRVIALEQMVSAIDYRHLKSQWPMALVVGNEVTGIPRVMSHNLDAVIEIPMRGTKESLNVAVAAGIALYELTRRWK